MKYFSKNNFTTKESKTIVLTLMLVFFSTSIFAQRGVRIGYIDTEYILENITEYQNAQSQLEIKVQQWKTEVEQRIAELETQKTQLNNERVLLTNELIEEREEDLQIIENEILEYQQKRFGPNEVVSSLEERPMDAPWIVMDSSLAQNAWNWSVKTKLEQILDEIADHAEKNPNWLSLTN